MTTCPFCRQPLKLVSERLYHFTCGTLIPVGDEKNRHHQDLLCIQAENQILMERVASLEDIIKRADRAFFKDGSDGKAASAMLTVLHEALIPLTGIDRHADRIDKLEVYVEDLECALDKACDLLSDSDRHDDRDKALELLKTKRVIA